MNPQQYPALPSRLTQGLRAAALLAASAGLSFSAAAHAASSAATGPVETVAEQRGLSETQIQQLRADRFELDRRGLAIGGYDPVAYFPEGGGEPAKGDKKLSLEHRGVTYRFSSQANMELFKASPEKYEPAYGGWCAYAMAKDTYTEPNPKRFSIENGRLLLFYDGVFGDTLKSWNEEGPAKLTPLADRFWDSELDEAATKILK